MAAKGTIDAMEEQMERWLGTKEPNAIQSWYRQRNGSAYNYNFPWCDATITRAAVDSGCYDSVCFGTDYAYTVAHAARFNAKGAWHPMNKGVKGTGIRRGDIIFFDWDGSYSIGAIDHIGFVTAVKGDAVYTIEGNTANVCARRVRYVADIAGFGRPVYKAATTKPSTPAPPAQTTTGLGIRGIDVASYQPEKPDLTGMDFCIVKATEGTTYVNPDHEEQVAHARAQKRVVGHYYFARPGSMTKQVDYFLKHAKAQTDEFLVMDWEDDGISGAQKDEALKYLKSKSGGRKVLLYCNVNFWLNKDTTSFAADGLWIAQYGVGAGKPKIKHPWVIHQYTDSPVDTNVTRWKTRADMAAWAGTKPPAKKPTVDLSKLVAAAKKDPPKSGSPVSYSEAKTVEAALKAEGLLSAVYVDGHFGTQTKSAYAAWQRRLGYTGKDADGIPGSTSLKKLGERHGFTVTAQAERPCSTSSSERILP